MCVVVYKHVIIIKNIKTLKLYHCSLIQKPPAHYNVLQEFVSINDDVVVAMGCIAARGEIIAQ